MGYYSANILKDRFWRKEILQNTNICSFSRNWEYEKEINNIKIKDYHDNNLDIEVARDLKNKGDLNFYEGCFIHKIDSLSFSKFKSIIKSFFKNKEKIIIISS